MPRCGEHLPDRVVVRPPNDGHVGEQDRVAHVEERRVVRRELHRPGHQRLGGPRAERSRRSHRVCAQISPSRVHLGAAADVAVVGVGVAAAVAGRRRRCTAVRRGADRAVDRLGAVEGDARAVVLEQDHVDLARLVLLQLLLDQVVHGVPVAPGLAHRAGLHAAERGVARRRRRRAGWTGRACTRGRRCRPRRRRWSARTGRRPGTTCPAGAAGTSASAATWPSGGVAMLALSMWSPSGRPWSVLAPSSVCVWTASLAPALAGCG